MTPDEYCQDKAAQSGSSFYYAFRFLPEAKRRAITAFYAFCREVDNIVDETSDPGVAQTKLGYWRKEVDSTFTGQAAHPVMRALAPHIESMRLPQSAFHTVIDGMQQDLVKTRYLDFTELQEYCYKAAGVVGEVSARIFGMQSHDDERTLAYARALGEALQLTNIIRDVGEDARRGRVYLPQEDLDRFGVSAGTLIASPRDAAGEGFQTLMAFQFDRAVATYDRAFTALPAHDRKQQRPGLAMGAVYRALLDEIQIDGFRVLEHRVSLTPIRKLWIVWKTVTFA